MKAYLETIWKTLVNTLKIALPIGKHFSHFSIFLKARYCCYSVFHKSIAPLMFLEIMVIIKIESHACYSINLWLIWIGMKQKKYGRQAVWSKINLLHIGWLLSKTNSLRINWSYSPEDHFLKFWRKLLYFWWWLKNSVFLSRPFWKIFVEKYFFLLHSYFLNQSQIIGVAWMGLNYYDYNDFQKNQGGGGYILMKHTLF